MTPRYNPLLAAFSSDSHVHQEMMNLVLNRIAQNKIYREDVERGVKNKRKSLLDFFSVKKMKKKTVYKEKANKEPLKFLTLKPNKI